MHSRKVLNIKTNMFELKIFWNGYLVSLQIAVLVGVLVMLIFAKASTVKQLCLIILLMNLFAVLVALLYGASISIENANSLDDVKSPQPVQQKETLDVTVDVKKPNTKKDAKQTQKQSEKVINNKVPIPNQKKPAPSNSAPPPTQHEEQPAQQEAAKSLENMTEQDWEDLFKMD